MTDKNFKEYLPIFLLFFSFSSFSQNKLDKNAANDSMQFAIKEVVVSTQRKDANITQLTLGVEKLNIAEIKRMPALMGEVDILKAIQLLPGVQFTSEGGSGFSVRGGSPDQNLIVLDNTTVYNPSHVLGFFSVFNNDVISEIELYKGDFPFKFGGRLASLLEVRTKEERPQQLNGTGGIGLISSRLMLEGNLGEKTSWLIAGRRSYADLFLYLAPDENLRGTKAYFYDLNGKISHRFSAKDRLDLNIYYGNDNFGPKNTADFQYGNTAASLTWNHTFSNELLGKFSLNYSDYNYFIASYLDGAKMKWNAGITDLMFRADFRHLLSEAWDLSYGASAIAHRFNPGYIRIETLDDYRVPGNNDAMEYAAYLSNEQSLTEKISLRYGLRFSAFQNLGSANHLYMRVEPGLSAMYRINEASSLKVHYSHNSQYLQLANNSASGSPLNVWFPASSKVKPQEVDFFSGGYFRNFSEDAYEASVELYYKHLDNVIDFADHAILIANPNLEDEIREGKGKAYGAEWMLKKNSGKLTGFVNYTLSRTERTIPEINGGKTYLAPFDKTHAVNVVANYEFSKKINCSATWVYSTGTPTTYPTGRFEIGGEYFPIYSGRNEYRRPDYHRLDLSLNYIPNPNSTKRWKSEWNLSIYNVYNRKNPWIIYYRQDDGGVPYSEMMYLFGIVPSITYNFKF